MALREKSGMTQRELAAALDVNHNTIVRIEQGDRRVDFCEFYQILNALGANPKREMSRMLTKFQELDGSS